VLLIVQGGVLWISVLSVSDKCLQIYEYPAFSRNCFFLFGGKFTRITSMNNDYWSGFRVNRFKQVDSKEKYVIGNTEKFKNP
jgi:hypothetical protein